MTFRNCKEDKTINLTFILCIFSVDYKTFKPRYKESLTNAVPKVTVFLSRINVTRPSIPFFRPFTKPKEPQIC
jgi:hypothetical protein